MSARRRLPSRLGSVPRAGLRSLGSRRSWPTGCWPTRWRAVSDIAVSDAEGKAVTAGVVGQALPEPYVLGSGDRVPSELRRVLGGYAGIAFAGALACAAAAALSILLTPPTTLQTGCCSSSCSSGRGLGAVRALQAPRRVSDFPGCSGGPAIHARPR